MHVSTESATSYDIHAFEKEMPLRLNMVLTVNRHEGGVALVTLSASASKNTFTRKNINVLAETLDELMNDKKCLSIILTGTGNFFSAGGPIDEFANAIDAGTIGTMVEEMTGSLHPLLLKIRASPKVFVAAINGAAAGGGLGLALAMDYRISLRNAKLAAAFFSLGLSPDGGTTWLLPRLVGTQVTKRFFFNNEIWDGDKALRLGAVDEVCNSEELISKSISLARDWGKWSIMSRRSTKQLLDASTSTFFETQLEFERALMVSASLTQEFSEGVSSFLEKRKPNFNNLGEE
ncbi:MAG: enoyl-CoA hydratase/isomerase family protein [Candidatus Poseidoniales archaeon]|jgi:2-(1,2-epoxy-1,2-dihydrophenyl)acetyl-CoA isomerase|tara:strand:- start:12549 stop:13421 length:873 start_codon:yes stop_codon:yes gene_type:complete